jgi:membrane fusion protein (multidrug efflux system)
MKKKMLAGVVALVLIAGAYYLATGHSDVGPAQAQMATGQRPPTEVTVETIGTQSLVLTQDLPGRTSAYQVAEIRPQVSGIIIDRLFEEGSLVREGQQLYQIDAAPYRAAYDSTIAALRKAEANLKSVEPKLVRYQELVEVGGVSRQDYDDVVAQLEQAKADVAVSKAAVATAKINLNYTKVFAPISGRIGKSVVTRGALVTANQAAALATVQNLSKIYVDVSQSSAEMMKLRRQFLGDEQSGKMIAKLLLEGETQPYALDGEVQFSDVSVDEGTGMIQLRILFPNPDGYLLPGLFVKARIPQSKLEDAIVVPQQAVVRGAGGNASVWLVGEGDRVAVQPVSTERALDDKWLISSGLQQGDRIVVSGLQKIAPGAQVSAVEATAVQ